MATEVKKIQFRHGNKNDLVPEDLIPAEPFVTDDTEEFGVKTGDGDLLLAATAGGGRNKAVLASEKDATSGIPILDEHKKVVEDPASYGKANGATLNPSTLPTVAAIVKLLGGVLYPAGFNDFATGIASNYLPEPSYKGYYIRFPDGTLICIKRFTGTANINSPWGSMYETQLTFNEAWPVSFVEDDSNRLTVIPVCRVGTSVNGGLSQTVLFEGANYDKQYLNSMFIMRPVSGTVTYDISFVAIGRWK